MNIIKEIKKYLIETCNFEYIGLKFIYLFPEKQMYTVLIEFDKQLNTLSIKQITQSDKIESKYLIDYINNMFYINPLLIDFTKDFQRIPLKHKQSGYIYNKYKNYLYLNFKYGILQDKFDIFYDKNWKNKLKKDKNKYCKILSNERQGLFRRMIE